MLRVKIGIVSEGPFGRIQTERNRNDGVGSHCPRVAICCQRAKKIQYSTGSLSEGIGGRRKRQRLLGAELSVSLLVGRIFFFFFLSRCLRSDAGSSDQMVRDKSATQ
ncbi:hypothetical protein J3F84DRAFT_193124 [Trichoderma pleuroticola]